MSYCIYLRKSRADMDAELRGEGETLARHERTLLDLCRRMNITPSAIYREIVSGETIAARPVMQQLLSEVQEGKWRGVIVMEVERLARGDTIDQGLVSQAFRISNTKIITPMKTFDPSNEFDEEYFEFNLFMSRREYKTIRRRMQAGRAASTREGKYVGSVRPYGYERVPLSGNDGFTLEPVPAEAEIIRCIYNWYLHGLNGEEMGCQRIARRLNSMNIPALRGGPFTVPTIRDILRNPLYMGRLRWNRRKSVKSMKDGQTSVSRPVSKEYLIADGLHPAIVDEVTWHAVQNKINRNPPRPVGVADTIQNPFAGLITCNVCSRAMVRRPYQQPGKVASLLCQFPGCATVGSNIDVVEKIVVQTLTEWSVADKLPAASPAVSNPSQESKIISTLQVELKKQTAQLNRLYDLLEQGVYSTDEFVERSTILKKRIADTKNAIEREQQQTADEIPLDDLIRAIAPKAREVLSSYSPTLSPAVKNQLFSTVIHSIIYDKLKRHIAPTLIITPKRY